RGQPERVVVPGAVDVDVVVAVVAAGDAQERIAAVRVLLVEVRRGAGEVGEAARDRRQRLERLLVHVRRSAGARLAERRLAADVDGLRQGRDRRLELERLVLAETRRRRKRPSDVLTALRSNRSKRLWTSWSRRPSACGVPAPCRAADRLP